MSRRPSLLTSATAAVSLAPPSIIVAWKGTSGGRGPITTPAANIIVATYFDSIGCLPNNGRSGVQEAIRGSSKKQDYLLMSSVLLISSEVFHLLTISGVSVTGPTRPDGSGSHAAAEKRPSGPRFCGNRDGMLTL